MSRKLVFVNASAETLNIESAGVFTIVKVDGLGTPETMMQEQKAPFQDGTTYIDALFQPRTITVELAITKPNDFTDIDTYRRELSKKLNPKLGQGTLTYTTEGGTSYKITAIPMASPTFPNKDYRDPYARAQVTFYCNDPYWKKTTADTINLPTAITSAETIIHNDVSQYPTAILQSNGTRRVMYRLSSDGYIYQKTSADGVTWSAASAVVSAISIFPELTQLEDDTFVLTDRRGADNYLVLRTSADGTTWSGETVIVAAAVYKGITRQLLDGSYLCIYILTADGDMYSKKSAALASWSAAVSVSTTNTSSPFSFIQETNGTLIVTYQGPSSYVVLKTSDDFAVTWSAENIINPAISSHPAIASINNLYYLSIYRTSTGDMASRISLDLITWSAQSNIADYDIEEPQVVLETYNTYRIVYINTTSDYVAQLLRSVTAVAATVIGDYKTSLSVTFTGPSVNPRIVNLNTLEYIRLNTTLAAGDTFVVNTAFGQKTVVLTQGGIVKNGTAYLDIGSTFFQLNVGANTIYFEDDAIASTATATMTWTERYVGV